MSITSRCYLMIEHKVSDGLEFQKIYPSSNHEILNEGSVFSRFTFLVRTFSTSLSV